MKTTNSQATLPACPVPQNERCCSVTLYRVLQNEPGIKEITWDTIQLKLTITFDTKIVPGKKMQNILTNVSHHLEERSATCQDRGKRKFRRGCGVCLQQLQRKARTNSVDSRCIDVDCTSQALFSRDAITLKKGVLRVGSGDNPKESTSPRRESWITRTISLGKGQVPQELISGKDTKQAHKTDGSGGETEVQNGSFIRTGIQKLKKLPLEPVFVVITLVGLISGAIAERIGPQWLMIFGYLAAYLTGGYFGVLASLESLKNKKLDIDLLMVLAALGAALVGAPFEGALLLFLFSFSNVLQDFALEKTKSAIKALSKLRPDTALVVDSLDSSESRRMKVEDITIGTLVQIKPGARIPLDGIIRRGTSSIDQSSITGESMPVDKSPGMDVLAGTINQDGEFVLEVTKTSSESTIAKVITLVEEAREQQAKTERFLDKFEEYYAGVVILATVLAAVLPPVLLGWTWSEAVYKAITLMVAASPCALIISTPASILSSIGNGARKGILFKGGVHVEQAANIQAVAFDKTGTLTLGKPQVSDIISFGVWDSSRVLSAAASLESKSEHVLAQAIINRAGNDGITYSNPQNFRSEAGIGVRGILDGWDLQLGNPNLLDKLGANTPEITEARRQIGELQNQTKTVIVLMGHGVSEGNSGNADSEVEHHILGLIALEDTLRPGVKEMISDLRRAGIRHVVMLTGDNKATAQAIAEQAGIDTVVPELMPEDKLDAIRAIETQFGPTAMVGDGVNDAPALAGARLGIAMGAAGTDVALETADIVLLSDDLSKIPYLIALSRSTRRTLITNIGVALGLIVMMIIGIYTFDLPLPLAVIGHEGGTVLVSLNGVRLLMFKQSRKARGVQ